MKKNKLKELIRLKSTDGRLSGEKLDESLQLLAFTIDLVDGFLDKGTYHASSDHIEQIRRYACAGCDSVFISKYPEWEFNFKHKNNCKYLRCLQLIEGLNIDPTKKD